MLLFTIKLLKTTTLSKLLIVLTRVYAGSSSLTCKIVPLVFLLACSGVNSLAREDHPLPGPDKLPDTGADTGDKCEV